MGLLRSAREKLLLRALRSREYESLYLRRYFERTHSIRIGLYTFGAFDRWRIPPGTTIGRWCSFAPTSRLLDANHPVGALSTSPYFYEAKRGLVDRNRVVSKPITVGDDVWLSHNAVSTPGCQTIGRGAIIGAGAVVTRDVPPYAIVVGAPAKIVRMRFDDATIDAIEATRWWELDKAELARRLAAAPGFLDAPTPEGARAFTGASGEVVRPVATAPVLQS